MSNTWGQHLTIQAALSLSRPCQKHLELMNCASHYQNIEKNFTYSSIPPPPCYSVVNKHISKGTRVCRHFFTLFLKCLFFLFSFFFCVCICVNLGHTQLIVIIVTLLILTPETSMYLYVLLFTQKLWVEYLPMAQETEVQSQVKSYQWLKKKWYLMPPCLTDQG